jgi:hypothetical protein
MGEWKRLQNEQLHSFYRSPNIVRENKPRRFKLAGRVARIEEGRRAFKMFTPTPAGKKLLGRPRFRWENHIRIIPRDIGINTRKWVY